jgi:hypothetical protein
MRMPQDVYATYEMHSSRLLVEKIFRPIFDIYPGNSDAALEFQRQWCLNDPLEGILFLTDICITVYLTPGGANACEALAFLLEIGKRRQFTNPLRIQNRADAPEPTPRQLLVILNTYPKNMAYAPLRALASPNCDITISALEASFEVGVTFPVSFWDALAEKQNSRGIEYANLDARELLYASPSATPLHISELQKNAAAFFRENCTPDDIAEKLSEFQGVNSITIFQDIHREQWLEINIGDKKISHAEIVNGLARFGNPAALVLNILQENLPPRVAFDAFIVIILYSWVQGECARVLLGIIECLGARGAFVAPGIGAASLTLYESGRSNGKIVVTIYADASVEILSVVAYNGIPPNAMPPDSPIGRALPCTQMRVNCKFTVRNPLIFAYTAMMARPNENVEIRKAQIALRV